MYPKQLNTYKLLTIADRKCVILLITNYKVSKRFTYKKYKW